ncbi:MAG: ribosome maturation factor RimM [Lachnospiraceae bacterium]|nr:ribosome maturation factor RimM [Robinsoniella sp.]MDY3767096.1 ribosome maturation factor RimM [Lachnospiraceae bacterium]
MEEMFQVGVISATHGLKGEVKVFPTTDDVQRFKKLKEVMLDTGKELKKLEVEHVKFFKQFVIMKFRGYDDISDVEKWRKRPLKVYRDQAVPLKKDEYYIADLIDMEVYLEDETLFGTLKDVLQTGANDVYVIETLQGQEVLLPAIKECIRGVDVEHGRMTVYVMPGLM